MVFNSFEFLLFLPVVFLLYWLVFKQRRWQNLFIVAASYIFYGRWDWRFLILIVITTLCSWAGGIAIEHYSSKSRTVQKWISTANIIINLSILGLFKYYNFFADSLKAILTDIGFHADFVTLNIILPVGISFYTFQALSYTIDIYRGRVRATHDPVEFSAFISFFPQLVAGPIERATNLLPQFQKERHFDYNSAVDGCRQMLWGFFKKVVVADNCAYYANMAFDNHNEMGSLSLLLGAIFFTFQIYCDFSGYSSIAIGCAKLFGIKLQSNFKVPYFSCDIAEFWKRWHISLNRWFVDYVYIPLGGSRVSGMKVIRNIFVIFLLSGLWHGANWTYVTWGLYHACIFVPLILFKKNHRYDTGFRKDKALPTLTETGRMIVTFCIVMIGWVIFRATSLADAWEYISRLFSFERNCAMRISIRGCAWLIYTIMGVMSVEWWNRNEEHEFHRIIPSAFIRNVAYIILTAWIYKSYMMSIFDDATFIYFRF